MADDVIYGRLLATQAALGALLAGIDAGWADEETVEAARIVLTDGASWEDAVTLGSARAGERTRLRALVDRAAN
jgi:hypothetical protein